MPGSALLAGSTGLVGGLLLKRLLADPAFTSVTALARRPLTETSAKLGTVLCDYATLDAHRDEIRGDIVFCCLGTTQKIAGSPEKFYEVDHDYPVKLGEIARANGAHTYILVSAVGARLGSPSTYMRTKAEAERDVAALGLPSFHVLRPSLILGQRPDQRLKEEIGQRILPYLAPLMVRRLRKFRPIAADQIAKAAVAIAKADRPGSHIHQSDALAAY